MKKKAIALILAVLLALSCAPFGMAYTTEAMRAATHLNQLGMFAGSGSNPDGTPNYKLDDKPKRTEGIVMLLALLGEREKADGSHTSPFTDVPAWAKKYVNYAYQQKYTSGVSSTKFGSGKTVSSNEYLTFVLTAMGYSSKTDFNWKDPYTLADSLGITNGKYNLNSAFTRGDMCVISDNALGAKIKGADKTLMDKLIEQGVLEPEEKPGGFNEAEVIDQLETQEFTYTNAYNRKTFLRVKNGSKYDLRLTVSATFYDEAGNVTEVKNQSQDAFEHGQEILLIFDPLKKESVRGEYKFSVKEETYFVSDRSDLTYTQSVSNNKVYYTLTNHGTRVINDVNVRILFFKDGQPVHYVATGMGSGAKLQPGQTYSSMGLDFWGVEFDSVQVYLMSWHSKGM